MAKATSIAAETKQSSQVLIVYANDIPYIGLVDPDDLNNPSTGVSVRKPFVLNIRPITDQKGDKLETVVLDIMLPVELAGLPLSENMYTGLVNFTPTTLKLPSGKSSPLSIEGGVVGMNRIASVADREDPLVWLFNVQKVLMPSDDMRVIYESKAAKYNELLYTARMVELQGMAESAAQEPEPQQTENKPAGANVIDMGSRTVH